MISLDNGKNIKNYNLGSNSFGGQKYKSTLVIYKSKFCKNFSQVLSFLHF